MKLQLHILLFALAVVASGCAQKKYEASVLLVVRVNAAESWKHFAHDGLDSIDLNTRLKVMKSDNVWREYVAPRLKKKLSSEEHVRQSVRLTRGSLHEDAGLVHLAEVRITIIGRPNDDLESVVEGMLAGLENWTARYGPQYAPYVRRP